MVNLITGATGNIGGRVVERLLERKVRPRILVRSVEKARARFGDRVDIVVGDLADERSLASAFSGSDVVFLVNGGPDLARLDEASAKVAKATGLKRIVKLSSMDARPSDTMSAVGSWHARGEAAIRASGIVYTFVQPAGFMSNALGWETSIKAGGVVRASTGDGRIAMIHPDDIAAVAVEALTTRTFDGQSLLITGPEALSYAEMTAKIGAAIGRSLTFQSISDERAREGLIKIGLPPELADGIVTLWRSVREGHSCTVTKNVERIVGRRAISFDVWARENAAAYL